ncbi:MAG: hypothetical protein AAF512_09650 [Pseudomonadota bacterium]
MPKETQLIEGQYYHLYNRGNNGENLFLEPRNYEYFLKLYARYIYPAADTFAYCLMKNHFHLLVRMKPLCDSQPSYAEVFSTFFSTYTKTINKQYQRTGSLFEKPFKRILVESERHLLHLVCYLHRNPQKHGFVKDFRQWSHSSYQVIAHNHKTRLAKDEVVSWFGRFEAFESYHSKFDEKMIGYLVEGDEG